MDYLWIFYVFFMDFLCFFMDFLWMFLWIFFGCSMSKIPETTATPAVRYLTTTTTILCSVLLFFLAVNSKIKYFSCSCTYSCYFYWVVSLGLVYFFSRLRRANSKW